MRARLLHFFGNLLLSSLVLALGFAFVFAQSQGPAQDLLGLINDARLSQGLYPYVVSRELTAAAQRHSDDMATSGNISHTGSDGSSSTQRILEAGYSVYEFGPLASENIYGGTGGARDAFDTWMEQPGARSNVLSDEYREAGIGVTNDSQGRTFWTLNVGAQPNVLPVLINDGAPRVNTITVTLRLVPENVVPEGRGTAMGQPQEYRASTNPQFLSAEWASWAEQVGFVLDESPGQQTVYVQLRDAAGRTTVAQASVILTDTQLIVTPTMTPVAEPSATPTPIIVATPTSPAVPSPSPTGTPTASPTSAPTETSTSIPSPSPTSAPTSPPTASATTQPTASATPSPTVTDTPPPTRVPPTVPPATTTIPPAPTEPATRLPTPTAPPPEETLALSKPIQPVASGRVVEEAAESPSLASRLAPWALGLQIVALVLGVYVALRRPGEIAEGEDHER